MAGAVNVGMLIAVRVIHGGGQGMLLTLVPLYLSEVAPPHIRGFLTGLTTLSFGIGYVMSVRYDASLKGIWLTLAVTASVGFPLRAIMPRTLL